MSTRGWYEYYVLDAATGRGALSMPFYKWGDATPENALNELLFFKGIRDKIGGLFPAYLLDDMLREQLGPAYKELPDYFPIACYLFLLLRAREELSWWKTGRYRDMPLKERPDYNYGFQIGKAMALHNFPTDDHGDRYIGTANSYIAAGKYIRPWARYCLKFSVLQWIQILTQSTMELDMGSIAHSFRSPGDNDFIYRYFIFVVSEGDHRRPVEEIRLQVCDASGADLLSGEAAMDRNQSDEEWVLDMRADLLQEFEKAGVHAYSLEEVLRTYQMAPSSLRKSSPE
ncbi:MAG: hypothetical protein V2B18_00910 [Pseudomonadota bacterium]